MKNKNKRVVSFLPFYLFTFLLLTTACSDRADYNEDPLDPSVSANKTLWENISENSELSDFASLLKKAGMDKELSQPSFYTVWAPLNGTYNASALLLQDSATLRSHFAMNHIANYNHLVSGNIDERIKALNEKSYDLKGSGTYTFAGVRMDQVNLPSVNGLMHTLNGEVNYYPNIYEYISQVQGCDSVTNYYKHYEHRTLDTENSIVGPVVNGRQTYIDSVMIVNNDLYRALSARIAVEDSSYTMMMPTNKAWNTMYEKIKPYYNYIDHTVYQIMDGATQSSIPTSSIDINSAYYTDSITKRLIVSMLTFNNNSRLNRWVENGGDYTDTLRLTTGFSLTNPREFLDQTKEKVTMSNGFARIVDSLAVRPWETYAPERTSLRLGTAFNASTSYVNVLNVDTSKVTLEDGETTLRYLHVAPQYNYSQPRAIMMLPNALSTSYNIYVVLVPENVDLEKPNVTTKSNQLNFQISYCNANGTVRAIQNLRQRVTNDPSKVDTVYAGTVTFPVCYSGLGNTVAPNLKIISNVRGNNARFTADIRLAAVILRPVEYDEFLGNKH